MVWYSLALDRFFWAILTQIGQGLTSPLPRSGSLIVFCVVCNTFILSVVVPYLILRRPDTIILFLVGYPQVIHKLPPPPKKRSSRNVIGLIHKQG